MGFKERLEKNIAKLEKRVEKEEKRIEHLHEKYNSKKITKAKFNIEKRKIDEKIRMMKRRISDLHGWTVKEKHHQEEKQKKKEEKKKKKKK
jgi:hypothetical protein